MARIWRIVPPMAPQAEPADLVESAPPGGDIFIPGLPKGVAKLFVRHPRRDWTVEGREIRSLVPTGARILLHP